MNPQPESHSPDGAARPRRGGAAARTARLALKELRETLRDRRTILTLLLMPLLVYPLLSLAFQRFLLTTLRLEDHPIFHIGVESNEDAQILIEYLQLGATFGDREAARRAVGEGAPSAEPPSPFDRDPDRPDLEFFTFSDLDRKVANLDVDLGVRVLSEQPVQRLRWFDQSVEFELLYVRRTPASEQARDYVASRLRAVNDEAHRLRLRQLGLPPESLPIRSHLRPVEVEDSTPHYSLAVLVPLILILLTIVGGVYPAIDLTAGERERGTLEALLAAPVPRLGLLLAKYAAVLTVSLLTAVVNLAAMIVTLQSTGLGPLLFGEMGFSPALAGQVFALLVLFAALFSAVLLAVTSFARSFKEAQAYLIPLMVVSIAPGLLSLMPGLRLSGFLAVVPLANIVLLSRDLLIGNADPLTATMVVLSTALYALAALTLAARIFGTDAILYGSRGSWSDLLQRPPEPLAVPPLASALFCLAVIFPLYVLLGSGLAQLRDVPLAGRLAMTAAVTALLFGGLPLAAAVFGRVRLASGFRMGAAPPLALVGAVLLGASLWVFAFEVVVWMQAGGHLLAESALRDPVEALLREWRTVPLPAILLAMAVVPAVFEELFFRGYLFGAVRTRMTAAGTIVVSGLLFGLFHFVAMHGLAFERFLPSTLLGFVLGWVCHRTGSVVPGIVLHACHNGLLLTIISYRSELTDWLEARWGALAEGAVLPVEIRWWAAGLILAGAALVWWSTIRETPKDEPDAPGRQS